MWYSQCCGKCDFSSYRSKLLTPIDFTSPSSTSSYKKKKLPNISKSLNKDILGSNFHVSAQECNKEYAQAKQSPTRKNKYDRQKLHFKHTRRRKWSNNHSDIITDHQNHKHKHTNTHTSLAAIVGLVIFTCSLASQAYSKLIILSMWTVVSFPCVCLRWLQQLIAHGHVPAVCIGDD